MRHTRSIALAVAIALMLALTVTGGCTKDEPAPPPANGETPNETDGDTETVEPTETVTPEPQDDMEVTLYWVSAGENALGVKRLVPRSEAVAKAALEALIAGPTDTEQTTWPAISSAIPEDTRLLGVTIEGGIAKVDFSEEFESGGGTFSVTSRLAQVVYTLEQFPTVDGVEFYIEGTRVIEFSSEGLILDKPQTFDDYDELLPIDA
jgi:spore germination protein GerM